MKSLIFLIAIGILLPISYNTASAQMNMGQTKVQNIPEGHVSTDYVCFVNNKYMGQEQIPVEVNGKTYYGCCQGCVGTLKFDRSARYAKDPLTGNEVDKASAYIVTMPGTGGMVQYFESKANFENYMKR
jgi:YHS domain-containing protein